MNKAGIYKITSPKGKIYIGQSIDLSKRFKQYRKYNNKSQTKLYNSIKKYGFSNHIFEIIEYCNIENLNSRERYWQLYYNSIDKDNLNCKLTNENDSNGKFSIDTCKRMAESSGHTLNEYYELFELVKLGKSKKEIVKKLNFEDGVIYRFRKGIHWFNKYLEEFDGIKYQEYKNYVVIGNLSEKIKENIIELYKSGKTTKDIKIDTGICLSTISLILKHIPKRKRTKKVAVFQYDLDGNFIRKWEDAKFAAQQLGLVKGCITSAANGRLKTYKKSIWKYY